MRFSSWRILPLLIAVAMLIGINQVGAMDQPHFNQTTPGAQASASQATAAPYFPHFKTTTGKDR
jgi:hypothetical protein